MVKLLLLICKMSDLKLRHTGGYSLAYHTYVKLIFTGGGYVLPGTQALNIRAENLGR